MEPRIIEGHRYLCKKNVVMYTIRQDGRRVKTKEVAYTKGQIYLGQKDFGYPGNHLACGFITDNKGDAHAWPYDPQHHPFAQDRWTNDFQDLDV